MLRSHNRRDTVAPVQSCDALDHDMPAASEGAPCTTVGSRERRWRKRIPFGGPRCSSVPLCLACFVGGSAADFGGDATSALLSPVGGSGVVAVASRVSAFSSWVRASTEADTARAQRPSHEETAQQADACPEWHCRALRSSRKEGFVRSLHDGGLQYGLVRFF